MKKVISTILLATICAIVVSHASTLRIDSEVRDLANFERVSVATGIHLHLIPGDENVAEIEADGIDSDQIMTKVSDGQLTIKVKTKNWLNFKGYKSKVNVWLTYTQLRAISASSGAKVTSKKAVENRALTIKASSGANIDLEIAADEVESSSSSGANVSLSGDCNHHYASASSGANIKSDDLESNYITAKASSGANIKVHANESIDAKASSGGGIKFAGNPSEVNRRKSSGGSVKRI